MSVDGMGMADEVSVEVNPDEEPASEAGMEEKIADDRLPSTGTLPNRPADSADKDKWIDYCVALGASRDYLTSDTQHVVTVDAVGEAEYEEHAALTKNELIDLADRLGG
jgi:hypothetical protein